MSYMAELAVHWRVTLIEAWEIEVERIAKILGLGQDFLGTAVDAGGMKPRSTRGRAPSTLSNPIRLLKKAVEHYPPDVTSSVRTFISNSAPIWQSREAHINCLNMRDRLSSDNSTTDTI